MFLRQVLRFATQAYNRYFTYRYVPFMHKPNDFIAFGHNRFLHENNNDSKRLGKLEGKMRLMFTCKKCKTRNSKIISKLAYNKGVIIVKCDCCKNNHLIADNLGWFSDMDKRTNIEKIMASKGENVRKIMNDINGYYEAIANKDDYIKLHQDDISQTKESDNDKRFEKIKELEDSNKS